MSSESHHHVRLAAPEDIAGLVPLLQAYMRETYTHPWHGSADSLAAHALGQRCSMLVATDPLQNPVGFLAWVPSYDLHHCVPGGEALDLYLAPPSRGRGLALLLGCAAAAHILKAGGRYLKGSVVPRGAGDRLYRRFGIRDAAGCIVSGRGFRRLAEHHGRSIREMMRHLPEPSWSYEA
jgi:GNAT superfamily N-acetyltransferase